MSLFGMWGLEWIVSVLWLWSQVNKIIVFSQWGRFLDMCKGLCGESARAVWAVWRCTWGVGGLCAGAMTQYGVKYTLCQGNVNQRKVPHPFIRLGDT